MKDCNLFLEDGFFYKANLHSHTILSDGKWNAAHTKEEYRKQGYSIVAFTDHNRYGWHKELTDSTFLPIAGFEVDINDFETITDFTGNLKTYHLNIYDTKPETRDKFIAIKPPQRYGDMHSLNEYIQKLNAQGFLVCYNHPWWSLQTNADYKDLRGIFAMEIYNHSCEQESLNGYAPQAYDEMLREGMHLFCLSTDDNHNYFPIEHPETDSFGGFTMIQATELTYKAVMYSLQTGMFYSSTGPLLKKLFIKDDILYVECSQVEKIFVTTQNRVCYLKIAPKGEFITNANFQLHGNEGYLRVDCAINGKHAFSNAYFLDKL